MYIQREVHMQVSKWGNSLAVRLPAMVVEALGLKEGDEIAIDVVGAAPLPGDARWPSRRGAECSSRSRLDPAAGLRVLS
jgi:hypothetical protein